ncbi:unnamed protein product, partial [Meganyctiphanes norvegica]
MMEEEVVSNQSTSSAASAQEYYNTRSSETEKLRLARERLHLQTLIDKGDEKVNLKPNPNGKSSIWSSFKLIFLSERRTNFVQCNGCYQVFQHKRQSGTSGLIYHSKMCKEGGGLSIQVKNELRQGILDLGTKWCCQSGRPFSIFTRDIYFRKLIKLILDVALDNKSISLNEILPSANTISAKVDSLSENSINLLRPQIKEAAATSLAVTLDIWTETHTKASYFGMTAHYGYEDSGRNIILGFTKITAADNNTLKSEISFILQRWEIEDRIDQLVYVTDSCFLFVKAQSKKLWVTCLKSSHRLMQLKTKQSSGREPMLHLLLPRQNLQSFLRTPILTWIQTLSRTENVLRVKTLLLLISLRRRQPGTPTECPGSEQLVQKIAVWHNLMKDFLRHQVTLLLCCHEILFQLSRGHVLLTVWHNLRIQSLFENPLPHLNLTHTLRTAVENCFVLAAHSLSVC